MKRRAVITLAGIVGPQAINVHQFWESVRAGNSGIRKIERFDAEPTGCEIGGEVPEFSLDFIPAKFKPKRLSRHTHLLLKAAQQLGSAIPGDGGFDLRIGLATSDSTMIAESGGKPISSPRCGRCALDVSGLSRRSADSIHRLRGGNGCGGLGGARYCARYSESCNCWRC